MIWKTNNALGEEVVWYSEDEYKKLKVILAEVKEIAEKTYRTPLAEKDCIDCDGYLHQILQKISEVENDR